MIQSRNSKDNLVNLDNFSEAISKQGYFIQSLAFDMETIYHLKGVAQHMKLEGKFQSAKIGQSKSIQLQQKIRGDEICWISEWQTPSLKKLRGLFSELVEKSKYELFQSSNGFESHFAFYPPGAAYARHVDRHKGDNSRIFSVILYIGPWMVGNGGELCLHPNNAETIKISPEPGKLVVFKSELEHEVIMTTADRWSITGWIRNDKI